MTIEEEELPELVVRDAAAWRRWLAAHHAKSNGVWLVLAKKETYKPTRIVYADALEEALAHGDGCRGDRRSPPAALWFRQSAGDRRRL